MTPESLARVDAWAPPWYAPWKTTGQAVAAAWAAGQPLHEALAAAGPAPVRFVPQGMLPPAVPYEAFVADTRSCPVCEGLHDFFNGLVWLRFPQAKRALNRLHAQAIARDGIGGRRGPARDAATVFDENGALLQAPPALWEALVAREWRRLFVDLRPLWSGARLMVFGHALLEQLAAPRKGLTAHVWCEPAPLEAPKDADAWLATRCTADVLAAKPFTPLPVLGVPGWHPENTNFSFYDVSHVFRPRKTPQQQTAATASVPPRT